MQSATWIFLAILPSTFSFESQDSLLDTTVSYLPMALAFAIPNFRPDPEELTRPLLCTLIMLGICDSVAVVELVVSVGGSDPTINLDLLIIPLFLVAFTHMFCYVAVPQYRSRGTLLIMILLFILLAIASVLVALLISTPTLLCDMTACILLGLFNSVVLEYHLLTDHPLDSNIGSKVIAIVTGPSLTLLMMGAVSPYNLLVFVMMDLVACFTTFASQKTLKSWIES
eukprot:gnl/Dysnectes_brevis/8763_a15824_194.p1 GENE.gnl/Dysnectes_brevis/8763_a15824_194~~gnl/Dysnectes_brevis/8763_a15824_194.p1  ORF type:complete len:260 (+),score=5.28 gnl/Dysnectes_brevis/8763_a15824_194:101-781(+)